MKSRRLFYSFLLPAFVLLLVLSLYALAGVFGLSLNKIDLRRPGLSGFTFQNYSSLIYDHRFWNSVKVSFGWLAATTSGSILIGLVLALFLFRRFGRRVETIVSILLIIPPILCRVGIAQAWRLLYRPFGLLNFFSSSIGLGFINWLGRPILAFISVVMVDIWQWCFLVAFLFLSLLNSIPPNYIEEAMVEGASRWKIHWHISLPIVSRGILAIFFIKLVESLRTFDLIYCLTGGGPGTATETLDLYAFYQGITIAGKISYAAAMSVMMLIFSLILLVVLWRLLWRKSTA